MRKHSPGSVVRLIVVLAASILAATSCGGGGGEGSASRTDTGTEELATTGEGAITPTTLELEGGKALAIGSEGGSVRQLQEALLALGHDPGGVDGAFGPATRRAVIDFQRDQELDADGIVGQATVAAINKELAAFTEDAER